MFQKLSILFFLAVFATACSNDNAGDSTADSQTDSQQSVQSEDGTDSEAPMPGMDMPKPLSSDELSDEELKNFALALEDVQEVNQAVQMEMIASVEKSGMTVERFTEMQEANVSGGEIDATEAERKTYDETLKALEGIQMEAQKSLIDKLEGYGISEQRYQVLAISLQSDTAIQKRFFELQGMPMPGGLQ